MEINGAQIKILSPYIKADRAEAVAKAISGCLEDGNINTPRRLAHFVAQCAQESWGFMHLTESLFYKDAVRLLHIFPSRIHSVTDARELIAAGPVAIANRVYAKKIGNGDEASGDGYKFRGRGFLQITGRYNYKTIGRQIGMDLEHHPEMLEDPNTAAIAAAKYWDFHACNHFADEDDLEAVTARINPALEGIDSRRAWLVKCEKIWCP